MKKISSPAGDIVSENSFAFVEIISGANITGELPGFFCPRYKPVNRGILFDSFFEVYLIYQ